MKFESPMNETLLVYGHSGADKTFDDWMKEGCPIDGANYRCEEREGITHCVTPKGKFKTMIFHTSCSRNFLNYLIHLTRDFHCYCIYSMQDGVVIGKEML